MDFWSWSPAGDLSSEPYWVQNSGAPWSISGRRETFRFEVRSGDHWPSDPVGSGKERSEIAGKDKLAFGRTYRIHYQFKVEPGSVNTADWLVLGQIHQTEDAGAADSSPPFEIDLRREKMALVVRWANWPLTPGAAPVARTLWSDPAGLKRGRWYDMVIEVRFDPSGDGALVVRRDRVPVASYRGPLGFANAVGPYWKQGVYRAAAPETIAVGFRRLSIREEEETSPQSMGRGPPFEGGWAQPKK